MNCPKCGFPLEEGVTTCPSCGADPNAAVETSVQPIVAPVVDSNAKIMAVLGYLIKVLFLVPMFTSKDNKWAMSHANNALILLILDVVRGAADKILDEIPVIDTVWSVANGVLGILLLIITILGIVAAAKEQDGESVPIIGKIKILK